MLCRVTIAGAAPTASAAIYRTPRSLARRHLAMPLRAKILERPAAMSSLRSIPPTDRDRVDRIRSLPDDPPEDVAFGSIYGLRTVVLNRPKKYNALNASMIRKIISRMAQWDNSDMANVVVIKGAGDVAFCAGGDVAALAELNQEEEGWRKSLGYFELEYGLDHYIATYPKPYVAFMDGITMGGGVGLSIHAPFRIATERTVFAMPETTIGFFPDVGASFFLPRLNGALGMYLALTSDRIRGVNVFYSGIATHYLHSTTLSMLEGRLAELRFKDYDSLEQRLKIVNDTLEEYATGVPHDEPMHLVSELRRAIDRCFSKMSVAAIIQALENEKGETAEWAARTLEKLRKRSPTSLLVTHRLIHDGPLYSLREAFQREWQLAAKFMRHPDFNEGVNALLVRKTNDPHWSPPTLAEANTASVVSHFFDEENRVDDLDFFVNRPDYKQYPHPWIALPTEDEVKSIVTKNQQGLSDKQELVRMLVESRGGRQGVDRVVQEMVDRVTDVRGGSLRWRHNT